MKTTTITDTFNIIDALDCLCADNGIATRGNPMFKMVSRSIETYCAATDELRRAAERTARAAAEILEGLEQNRAVHCTANVARQAADISEAAGKREAAIGAITLGLFHLGESIRGVADHDFTNTASRIVFGDSTF